MFLLVLAALTVAPQAEPGSELDALVDRVERHYDSVRDFEASFTQRYERKLLHRRIEEKGRVSVKKPGRMRWEYREPEEKLFVTDGAKSYFYLPLEQQVMVSHNPDGAMGMEEGSPFELLAGKSRLRDGFEVSPSDEPATRGGVVLHLAPRTLHEEFDEVALEVRESDGLVLRVVLVDAQDNRTEFEFTDVRENVNLSETLFRFAIPPGVDVVVHSSSGAR
jgi:outer membrane lipoprotein carrier protein